MANAPMPKALREVVRNPSLLREQRKQLDLLRSTHNREWALNRSFYKGDQWVVWNKVNSEVMSLGVDDGDQPRYKVRLTNNLITPGVQQLVAQMTKTRPVIHAVPETGADRDVKAAKLGERLYEYWWQEFHLGSKLKSALTHAQISQGYWWITWDPLAGKSMKVMLNPETGSIIHDQELADAFRDEIMREAEANQLDPMAVLGQFERPIYMGDISVQVLPGEQVWFDPIPSNVEDATYAIIRTRMSVDEIEARYKKRLPPDTTVGDTKPALLYTRGKEDQERPKNARDVFFGYFRPSPMLPKGRFVVWVEGPDEILHEEEWGFPFTDLPVIKFPGIENDGSIYDIARTTLVRPLQKELNNKVSKIAMHMNLTMKPQMVAPVGSLRQRLTDEPGAVFEYVPIQNLTPEWRPIPSLPGHVYDYITILRAEIDRRYNLMPSERSQLPQRTDSGHLVELMQEAVADQISNEIERMEEALARAGDIMAKLAQKYYIEPRLLKIRGEGGAIQVKKFQHADLAGGFSFHAQAGSGLPQTREGKIQQIREMIEMQVLTPQEALPYLPVAGLKSIQDRMMRDEDFAQRRIEQLIKGEPPNPFAAEQAIQQVQTGVNPMTGEMFQSPEEAIAYVQQEAMKPLPYENMAKTLEVVSDHMKSLEFASYPPQIQQNFLWHFEQLRASLSSLPANADIKVNLGLNGTIGPTVAAEILRDKGIASATPTTMAEQPLETSVYDSVDKPDADEAGNDPLTQAEQLQSMEQNAAEHALKTAKTASEIALARKRAQHTDEQHAQAMRHREEAHQKQQATKPSEG